VLGRPRGPRPWEVTFPDPSEIDGFKRELARYREGDGEPRKYDGRNLAYLLGAFAQAQEEVSGLGCEVAAFRDDYDFVVAERDQLAELLPGVNTRVEPT